jgi:hypothetical protein
MLHDRRQRNRERFRDFTDRHAVPLGQPGEDRAAGRIGKCREGVIQSVVLIVNHVVKY